MPIVRNLFIALFVLSAGTLAASIYWNLPLEILLVAVAGACLALYLGFRFPEWFLAAALFAPQWKTAPGLRTINSVADLTLAMLGCLIAGLIGRLLVGHRKLPDFRTIFAGQFNAILAFLTFLGVVGLSYLYTDAPDYGGTKLLRLVLIGGVLFAAPFFVLFSEEDFRHFVRIFVGFSAITALQLVTNLETRAQDAEGDITRIGAGWLIGMGIVFLLFYPLSRSGKVQRALVLFLLPLFSVGLMASASRGPMVAVAIVVALGVLTLLKLGRMRLRSAFLLVFFLAAGIGIAYVYLRQTDASKYTAKASELELLFTRGTVSGTAGKRLNYYESTLAAIPDHLLLGKGVGSWSIFYFGNDQRNYPHNIFLEIGFEEGMLGLAALLLLLSITGSSILRMLRESRYHFLCLELIVLYCVIVSLFSGDLDDDRVLWFWIGFTLAICRVVRLKVAAFRAASGYYQPSPVGMREPAVPAFARHFAPNRYSGL